VPADVDIAMTGNPAGDGAVDFGGDAGDYRAPDDAYENALPFDDAQGEGANEWSLAAGADRTWSDDDAPPAGPVPYEQFQEVNERLEALRGWEPIIQALQQEGYSNAEAVEAALQEQWRRQAQAEEDAWQQRQAAELQSLVDAGALDPMAAQQQFDLTLQQRQLEQDRAMYQEMRVQMELQAAAQQFPHMDPSYVTAMHYATGQPIAELAEMTHGWVTEIEQRALARYQAEKALDAALAAPEGAGGAMPVRQAPARDAWKLPYSRLFGIGRSA